jgi:hypothetical protein
MTWTQWREQFRKIAGELVSEFSAPRIELNPARWRLILIALVTIIAAVVIVFVAKR